MAVSGTSGRSTSRQPYDGNPRAYTGGYEHVTDHEYDPGVLVLPVASSASKTVKVRVHGGYSVRRVKFDVARDGNPPVIPEPTDIEGVTRSDILVSCVVSAPLPFPNFTTGSQTWQVQGEYVFVGKGVETVAVTSVPPTTASTVTSTDPANGTTTTVATTAGGVVTTTVATSAARLPGRDLLPLGGFPFSLGVVDAIGNAVLSSGASLLAISSQQESLVSSDRHLWPFTVLPPFVFNANLLKE